MTDTDRPRPATNPLRWVLLVMAFVLAGYAVYAAGGLTQRPNTTSSAARSHQLPSTPVGVLCPVSDGVTLSARVDVRIQAQQEEELIIARRTRADADAEGLHLPAGTPFGTGMISLGDGEYATFAFDADGCTTVIPRPPEPAPPVPEALP